MESSVDGVVATVEGADVVGVTLEVVTEIMKRFPTLSHTWALTGSEAREGMFYLFAEGLPKLPDARPVETARLVFADGPGPQVSETYAVVIEYLRPPSLTPIVAIKAGQKAVARLELDQIATDFGYKQPQ